MSLLKRLNSILDSPSRRKKGCYGEAISADAKRSVFLLLYQLPNQGYVAQWFDSVSNDFVHLHHDFIRYQNRLEHPLVAFERYLQQLC